MSRAFAGVSYAVVMALTIVTIDVALFRHQFGPRLLANVGVVLLFGALYWRFVART